MIYSSRVPCFHFGLYHAAIPLQSCRSSATVVVTSICLNASENFPRLLRMAHDRRRLRPAYTGRWAVLLRLFGFFLPLSHDLGLSRAATSLVFSLARAQGAFEGPVAGYIMDRFGPR